MDDYDVFSLTLINNKLYSLLRQKRNQQYYFAEMTFEYGFSSNNMVQIALADAPVKVFLYPIGNEN